MSDSWLDDEIERLEAELEEETENSLVKNTAGLGTEVMNLSRQMAFNTRTMVRKFNSDFDMYVKKELLYALFGKVYAMRKLDVGSSGRLLALQRVSDKKLCPIISMALTVVADGGTNITVGIYKGTFQAIQDSFVDGCHDLSDEEKDDRMRDAFKDLPVHVMLTFISSPNENDLNFVYGKGRCVIGDAGMPYEHGCINALGMILKRLWINAPFVLREIRTEIEKAVSKVQPEYVREKLKWTVDADRRADGIVDRTLWVMNGPHSSQWRQVLTFGMQRPSDAGEWTCIRLAVCCDTMDKIMSRATEDTVEQAREVVADATRGMTPLALQNLIRQRLDSALATVRDDAQATSLRSMVYERLLNVPQEGVHAALRSIGSLLPQQAAVLANRNIIQIMASLRIDASLSAIYGPCVMEYAQIDAILHKISNEQGCIAQIVSFLCRLWNISE